MEYLSVSLNQMPMCPSINQAYKTILINRTIRRCASKALNEFKKEFKDWVKKNPATVSTARASLEGHENALRLTLWFYFPHDRIFTKKNAVKRLDVSNRVKIIEDSLCEALGFDDRVFFNINIFKVQSEKECISALIESNNL